VYYTSIQIQIIAYSPPSQCQQSVVTTSKCDRLFMRFSQQTIHVLEYSPPKVARELALEILLIFL